jgi:chromosome segregation ATPase
MSKAAKKSVYILMALLVAALGFAYVTFTDLQEKTDSLDAVEKELTSAQNQFQAKEQKNMEAVKELKSTIEKLGNENNGLSEKVKEVELQAQQQAEIFSAEISTLTDDRDKWKRRIEAIKSERDQLMAKVDELNKKLEEKPEPQIVYKEKEPQDPKEAPDVSRAPSLSPENGHVVDEQYWANLLQEKASLEINIKGLKDELSAKSITLVEMKQKNEELQLQVNTLTSEKEEIKNKVQHTSAMIDNISLELARTKNDKKFIANRSEKLSSENEELRQKLKKLVSVKNALEKSIVRVTQDKEKVESQLGRTETLIQSKIDEIWDIKDELDLSIRSSQNKAPSNEVELPPIVVSSSGGTENFNTGQANPSFNGQVISINEPNNFVIVDIGENAGVHLGDNLSVYRDSKYIARLEVIQVREDISAADLKDQWSKIKVGDVIR